MNTLPFEFNRTSVFESFQFHHKIDLNLPENPLTIASNMATLMSGETYIVVLNNDGSFDKSYSIDDYQGIAKKVHALNEAKFMGWPIKVEDMETYNQPLVDLVAGLEAGLGRTVNGHMFIGFEGKGSFGWHTDEGHVFCYMLSGTKLMETQSGRHELNAGDWLIMPEGLPHCATNLTDTTMISFGTGSIKPRIKTEMLWADQPALIM